MKKRHLFYTLLCIVIINSCYFLALQAPFNAVAGIEQGIASLLYFASSETSIEEINTAFNQSNKEVTLKDTYAMAYGKSLAEA